MICKKCQKQYVGETKLQLNQRINLHRSNVNTVLPINFEEIMKKYIGPKNFVMSSKKN